MHEENKNKRDKGDGRKRETEKERGQRREERRKKDKRGGRTCEQDALLRSPVAVTWMTNFMSSGSQRYHRERGYVQRGSWHGLKHAKA